MNLKSYALKWYRQLISLKGDPHSIAYGMAIGVFIGVTPTIPFHTALIILLCFVLKKNITAAYLGSWLISNPLTIPFLYTTQYSLGKYLLGNGYPIVASERTLMSLIETGGDMLFPLLAGGLVMAPFFALLAYFITYNVIVRVRKRHHGHQNTKHT